MGAPPSPRSRSKESLYCIRCGACLNICPVYRKVGGHAYGWVYPGPIGAVISPVMVGLKEAKDLPHASSLCGACREVCPVKINIPHMLLKLRTQLAESPDAEERNVTFWERLLAWGYYRLMSSPRMVSSAHTLGRIAQVPVARKGTIKSVPIRPFPIGRRTGTCRPSRPGPSARSGTGNSPEKSKLPTKAWRRQGAGKGALHQIGPGGAGERPKDAADTLSAASGDH